MTTNLYVVVIVEYIFVGSGLFKKCLTLILKPLKSIESTFKVVSWSNIGNRTRGRRTRGRRTRGRRAQGRYFLKRVNTRANHMNHFNMDKRFF